MLPYLATVPHIDEGAHGVEGACPAGQQVCPVVGMQHTDIVGTVSLGGQQGTGRVTGYWYFAHPQFPASAWNPMTVGEPQPDYLGSTQALCLQHGARDLGWQLVPTDIAYIWVDPSPLQNDRAFYWSSCCQEHPRGTTWGPVATWASPAHRHLCTHPVTQSTLARGATSPALQAPNPAPNPWRPGHDQMQGHPSPSCSCLRQG